MKQGCVYKSAVRQRAFLFWGGEGAFIENRLSVRVCGYVYFR